MVSHNGSRSQSDHEHDQGELPASRLADEAAVRGLSFMSDVYSFGIVVWEVLSRKVRAGSVSEISGSRSSVVPESRLQRTKIYRKRSS